MKRALLAAPVVNPEGPGGNKDRY